MQASAVIPLWVGVLTAIVVVGGVIFSVCAFILRSKDLQAMKPTFDSIPIMARDIADQGRDLAEMKGIMSVVPALTTHLEHHATDIGDLKQRVLELERRRSATQ